MIFDPFFSTYATQEQLFDDFLSRHGGKFRRIMDEPLNDSEYIRSVAEIKRFLEVYTAKVEVRNRCRDLSEAQKVLDALGIELKAEDFRVIWDSDFLRNNEGAFWLGVNDLVLRYRCFMQEKIGHRSQLTQITCAPKNERLRVWRRRQQERIYTELGTEQAKSMIHTPLIFELSEGCSVGCWFCGVASKKKGGDFLHTAENSKLWRSILEFFKDFLGDAAGMGTCYYGTEPLDNPDYEQWCDDYADILGTFPQTTTAVALRDVERTRRLLKHSRERGTKVNRFSVLSEKILDDIHAAFSPTELLYTELITQNIEATSGFSLAGRARTHGEMIQKKAAITGAAQPTAPSSICCVSGFRLNMVRKTIDLITPCGADEKHPIGEYLLASDTFQDVAALERIVRDWTDNIITARLLPRNMAAFRPDLRVEMEEDKLLLHTRTSRFTYQNKLIPQIFEPLKAGDQSVFQIAEKVTANDPNLPYEVVFEFLDTLFQDGFLHESPEFFHQRRFAFSSQ
jgi:radical SAM family RiPP maturation amino acid epimerase